MDAPEAEPKIIEEDELVKKHYNCNHLTLEEFRKKIVSKSSDNVSEIDRLIVQQKPPENLPTLPISDTSSMECQKYDYNWKDTGVASRDYDPHWDSQALVQYPMRINIPRKMWKKDKIFRVRDCFYNDRGNFLYRVPGFVD